MNKDLPEMYRNNIKKKLDNNNYIYSSLSNDSIRNNTTNIVKKYAKYEIEKKINNILSSRDFIYQAEVIIETDDGKTKEKIIGKKDNYLITMNNDYINIDNIRDIYRK